MIKRPKSNPSSARASTTQPRPSSPHASAVETQAQESIRPGQTTHLYLPPHNHRAPTANSSFERPQSSYLLGATGSPEKVPAPTAPWSPTDAARLRNRAPSLACLSPSEPTQECQVDLPVHSLLVSQGRLGSQLGSLLQDSELRALPPCD